VLYNFKGANGDGAAPYAALIDVKGKLYGTTIGGGDEAGTVFSITPSGKERMLYSFKADSGDGESPYAGLTYVRGTCTARPHMGARTGTERSSRSRSTSSSSRKRCSTALAKAA